MAFKIRLTKAASQDLDEIYAYIGEDNLDVAQEFADELLDRTLPLSDFPEMGRVSPKFKNPAVRELVQGSYRVLPATKEIHILRFWRAARGEPSL